MVDIKNVVLRLSDGLATGDRIVVPGVIYYKSGDEVHSCEVEFDGKKLEDGRIDIAMLPLTEDECKPVLPLEDKIVNSSAVKAPFQRLFR